MQPETAQFPLETMAVRAEEMEIFCSLVGKFTLRAKSHYFSVEWVRIIEWSGGQEDSTELCLLDGSQSVGVDRC